MDLLGRDICFKSSAVTNSETGLGLTALLAALAVSLFILHCVPWSLSHGNLFSLVCPLISYWASGDSGRSSKGPISCPVEFFPCWDIPDFLGCPGSDVILLNKSLGGVYDLSVTFGIEARGFLETPLEICPHLRRRSSGFALVSISYLSSFSLTYFNKSSQERSDFFCCSRLDS